MTDFLQGEVEAAETDPEPQVGLEAGRQLKSQGRWLAVGGTFWGTLRTFVGI